MPAMSDEVDPTRDSTLDSFTEALASGRPTPGGGSAVALAGAMAAGLTAMVVRLSMERPRYEQHADLHAEALGASDVARGRFLELAEEDAAAYDSYREARRMAHGTDAEVQARASATREAARLAADVPLAVVQLCHRQMDLVERLAGRSNAAAASDLDVAALLLEAAARGAAANVLVNLPAVEDEGYSAAIIAELDQRLRQVQGAAARTHERVGRGGQRGPESA